MGQVAVYSAVERRRRWSDEERLLILEEAFAPGAIVTRVARRHDVSTALIYTWRRKLCSAPEASPQALDTGFAEAVVIEAAGPVPSSTAAAIVIDLARGRRMTIFASASPALATAALRALR